MRRSGFFASLGLALLGAIAAPFAYSPTAFSPASDGMELLGEYGSSSRGRPHIDTRGMRAHRRWRTARRSGRHDFRRTLAKG